MIGKNGGAAGRKLKDDIGGDGERWHYKFKLTACQAEQTDAGTKHKLK